MGFIRKVYAILGMQLVLTVMIATPMRMFVTQWWLLTHVVYFYTACIVPVAMLWCASCCCQSMMRTFPYNYIFMSIFTIFEAFMIGCMSSMYATHSVVFTVAVTAVLTLGLSLYAMLTKSDFTGYWPFMWGLLIALTCFSGFFAVFPLMGVPV